jgi:hypothetical protein
LLKSGTRLQSATKELPRIFYVALGVDGLGSDQHFCIRRKRLLNTDVLLLVSGILLKMELMALLAKTPYPEVSIPHQNPNTKAIIYNGVMRLWSPLVTAFPDLERRDPIVIGGCKKGRNISPCWAKIAALSGRIGSEFRQHAAALFRC